MSGKNTAKKEAASTAKKTAGTQEEQAARDVAIRSFEARCEKGKQGLDYPWDPPSEDTRKKYRQPGQPMAFSTPEEFYEGILAYFEECDSHTTPVIVKSREDGAKVVDLPDPKPKTVTALCTFLGIARSTFYNYLDEEHPFHVVADWFEQVSELSWSDQLLNPKRYKAAQFVLQAKHKYATRQDITSAGDKLKGGITFVSQMPLPDPPPEGI